MKIPRLQLLTACWIATQVGVHAFDPTEVDGAVHVGVDQSKPVWTVTVTNHSAQILTYEMMGKVPRGLGLEVWDVRDDPSKRFVSLWFVGEQDDVSIQLLLNGALLKTTRLGVTEEQYKELSEFGIPKLREKDGGAETGQ